MLSKNDSSRFRHVWKELSSLLYALDTWEYHGIRNKTCQNMDWSRMGPARGLPSPLDNDPWIQVVRSALAFRWAMVDVARPFGVPEEEHEAKTAQRYGCPYAHAWNDFGVCRHCLVMDKSSSSSSPKKSHSIQSLLPRWMLTASQRLTRLFAIMKLGRDMYRDLIKCEEMFVAQASKRPEDQLCPTTTYAWLACGAGSPTQWATQTLPNVLQQLSAHRSAMESSATGLFQFDFAWKDNELGRPVSSSDAAPQEEKNHVTSSLHRLCATMRDHHKRLYKNTTTGEPWDVLLTARPAQPAIWRPTGTCEPLGWQTYQLLCRHLRHVWWCHALFYYEWIQLAPLMPTMTDRERRVGWERAAHYLTLLLVSEGFELATHAASADGQGWQCFSTCWMHTNRAAYAVHHMTYAESLAQYRFHLSCLSNVVCSYVRLPTRPIAAASVPTTSLSDDDLVARLHTLVAL